jgi:hypothetical protein
VLVAAGLLGLPGGTLAQDEMVPQARTFGTASPIVHTIQSFGFRSVVDTTSYTSAGLNGALACTGGSCFFGAPVFLPAGALVTSIGLHLCDTDPVSNVSASLTRVATPSGGAAFLGALQSGGTPGCVLVTSDLATPETIDNQSNSYYFQVSLGGNTMTRVHSARLFYTLQVSSAPAVATFADVPTGHTFFRFVEALARSGITAGCGGGNFCPDAPLTRGQMAVFLSLGLGLHFAP